MSFQIFLPALLCAITLAAGASATTITASLFADAGTLFPTAIISDQVNDTVSDTDYQGDAAAAISVSAASASAVVNLAAGTVKFDARASTGSRRFGESREGSISSLDVRLEERFQVTGSGTVSFTAAIDGTLAATFVDPGNVGVRAGTSASLLARIVDPLGLSIDRTVGFDNFASSIDSVAFSNANRGDSRSRIIDDAVAVSFDVADGDFIDLLFSIEAGASTKSGPFVTASTADFLNTATLSFATSSGVSITPSNSAFLSGTTAPDPLAPVPLPAGLPLLLTGLGLGWGLLRSRGSKTL